MSLNSSLFESTSFLDDYVIDTKPTIGTTCKATIKNSNQKVLINKQPLDEKHSQRFKNLVSLFKDNIVLADNIFLTKQNDIIYANTVSVYLEKNSKFQSLKQYIQNKSHKQLIDSIQKLKYSIEKVHEKGQSFLNLHIQNIIVDSKGNLFLSPYVLDQGQYLQNIRTQQTPRQRAYLSPQILEQLMGRREGRLQIGRKSLIKNDYWCLGCIILQVFALATHPFLSVDLDYQLQMYHFLNESLRQWLKQIPRNLKGLLLNCLQKTSATRSISIQRQMIPEDEDNVLTINLLKLTNYQIRQQLQITVHLSSKYTFYFEPTQSIQTITLDKQIVISDYQQPLEELIMNPIKITFQDGTFKGQAFLTIGSLALKQNNKRVCRQPISGSYKITNTNARIKIQCDYRSPEQDNSEDSQIQIIMDKIQKQIIKASCQSDRIVLKQQQTQYWNRDKMKKKDQSSIQYMNDQVKSRRIQSISSIAQITQQIQGLKRQFSRNTSDKRNS